MSINDNTDSGRWPPKRNDMPELSNLTAKLTIDHILNRTFRGVGLQMDGPGQAQFHNLVRLVDKTLVEYEQARKYLRQYVDNNEIAFYFRCVDHMENCVDSLHRSFLHMEGLKRSLYTELKRTNEPLPQIAREELPKKKDRERVERIRGAIQHMDERIIDGRAGRDKDSIGLIVMSDSVALDYNEISFEELASWIQQIYRVVERLVAYTPSS